MGSRRGSKYRLPRERKTRRSRGGGGGGGWLVVLFLVTGIGAAVWFWWPRNPSARPIPPQQGGPAPVPLPQIEPPVTNRQNPSAAEPPNVRVSTNVVRQPGVRTNSAVRSPVFTNLTAHGEESPATASTNTPRTGRGPVPGRPARDPFEAQVALMRRGISPGSLDGALGSQTRAAIQVFQQLEGLPATGSLDATTRERLAVEGETEGRYLVTQADLDNLRNIPSTWLGKSQLDRLGFESILEQVAEMGHAHPALIRKLNPGVNWTNVAAGTAIRFPMADFPPPRARAVLIRISLGRKTLKAFDSDGSLLCFFPCSIAQRVEKRPMGDLRVEVVIRDPDYTFNPDVFPESAEARALNRRLVIRPGPNNPVGVAWIGLSRPGYGIHGTPKPEDVGRTESHGCFRLANWNADYLRQLVVVGTPVLVEP